MTAISTHDYFAAFAYLDPAAPEGTPFEFPIDPESAKTRTGIKNPNLIIASPPEGWYAIFRSDPPTVPDLCTMIDGRPIYREDISKWVQTFEIVEMTTEQIEQFFNDTRRNKELEINAARTTANNGFFLFSEKRIACDEVSMKDIIITNMLVMQNNALPPYFPGFWKTKDNDYVAIPNVATWHSFFASFYTQGIKNFLHSEALKLLIAQATSLNQIRAVSWATNTGITHS